MRLIVEVIVRVTLEFIVRLTAELIVRLTAELIVRVAVEVIVRPAADCFNSKGVVSGLMLRCPEMSDILSNWKLH